MKIELEDISHGKGRKDWTYDHGCILKVKRTDDSGSVTENEEFGYLVQGKDMIFLNSQKVYLPNLPTEHQDIAGAFEEVLGKLQDGEGGDIDDENYSFMDDPDWQLFKDTPDPASNQLVFAIRIINPTYRKAGSYYADWYVTQTDEQGNPMYAANQESKVECNVKIDLPRWLNFFDEPDTWEFVSYTIDWGDGSQSSFTGGKGKLSTLYKGAAGYDGGKETTSCHVYENVGTYIVTCTFDLSYPSGVTVGNYAVRVHDKNQWTDYVANAPITVFAKVGEGFGSYAANVATLTYEPLAQISAFGMNRTIKFLKGNFAKMMYTNLNSMWSLKYLSTDAIRGNRIRCAIPPNGEPTYYSDSPRDLNLSTFYCLELLEITSNEYTGTCYFKNENYGLLPINYSTTNEIKLDDEYPTFQGTFLNCYALKKLPEQILNVPAFSSNNIFQNCISLKSIDLPNCTSIGTNAFYNCKSLKKVSLPKIENIPNYCFYGCSALTDLNLPECVSVGQNAFSECTSLYEFNLKNVETIGGYAFPNGSLSKLKKIVLPKCTNIDNLNFQGSFMLSEFNCPLISSVPDYAFQNCFSLCIFEVAENCTFGANCFSNCHNLYPRPDGSVN